MELIHNELKKYKIIGSKIEIITNKAGVIVTRVKEKNNTYILKYFENNDDKREIQYYKLFNELGIKTIKLIAKTNDSILLEDIELSKEYRLSKKEDLESKKVIISLAKYYKNLHSKGRDYLKKNKEVSFYSEINSITNENINILKDKTKYLKEEFYKNLKQLILKIEPYYKNNKLITYNDFHYVNLIVSKDLKEVFMFDYNLVGEGLRYFDLSNVLCSLNENMKEVFIKEYGEYSYLEYEINSVLSHIIALTQAFKREVFPKWAEESLDELLSDRLEKKLYKLLNII